MILAITSVVINAFAQIFIKLLANSGAELNFSILRQWPLYATGLCYGISIVTWFLAMKTLALNVAYPLQAGGYVIVTILSGVIFGERISTIGVIALLIIVAGVVLLAFSGRS